MKKILIANRGEIAQRVMRTATRMGIATVAVYSDADSAAPFVRQADEAYRLGPAPSAQSYLRGELIIEIAQRCGADAIHPGYGFLSENAAFARAVREAGLIFIGPSPEAMELMGGKISAKQAVKKFGVPLVPGLDHAISDIALAKREAEQIGYPILIKASAGGGGKGMRTVERAEDFDQEMSLAVSEATKAFGDGSVFIERYVTKPRHIEIQVLADQHGNVVYLFERECSIQRRHQKVVEEAPSSVLSPELRQRMGEAAVAVCKACSYSNAGTVEFLIDAKHDFFFLEMNTRLQVEHPVTEFITGLDLVEQQLRIARGEALAFTQSELSIHGHAIEVRVCAEDPANTFLPDVGRLARYRLPHGDGIRVDGGFEEGMEIPIHYDPMLAKLIVHAPTREAAMDKMIEAIANFEIVGVETTLTFCRMVMQHPAFRSGDFDTGFVAQHFRPEMLVEQASPGEQVGLAAALSIAVSGLRSGLPAGQLPMPPQPLNPWWLAQR
jgi:acetyl-CoA carboxylase, biotin carboxylase subunit